MAAVLHRQDPSNIDYNSLNKVIQHHFDHYQGEREKNLKLAFDILELKYGVPQLLELEDLLCDKPEEKSIMTYLSLVIDALKKAGPAKVHECFTLVLAFQGGFNKTAVVAPPPVDSDELKALHEKVQQLSAQNQAVSILFVKTSKKWVTWLLFFVVLAFLIFLFCFFFGEVERSNAMTKSTSQKQ